MKKITTYVFSLNHRDPFDGRSQKNIVDTAVEAGSFKTLSRQ